MLLRAELEEPRLCECCPWFTQSYQMAKCKCPVLLLSVVGVTVT